MKNIFFENEVKSSNILYLKSYIIPELKALSNECMTNIEIKRNYILTDSYFKIIKNELLKIEEITFKDPMHVIKRLNLEDFTPEAKKDLENYLAAANNFALFQYRKISGEKDKQFETLINKIGNKDKFVQYKKEHYNKKLASIVLNENELLEFQLGKNEIVRIKDAIFTIPDSKIGRAHYYSPVKRIGPFTIDTFWFNVIRIWFSVILLYVFLYLDLLKKVIRYVENFRLRRINQRRFLRIFKQYQLR